ncbi:hypothetical protein ACFO4P_06225 [Epilithonimonas pallida]|uniref:Uncharacterized protein n=1 Tax=Epilithonimonas pallida TaxID=373671 RepID=A0ABY1R7D2_9FLAO|nr:hypothetical protein [Epilithonimonas pallida]SMP96488.1 hypothetical protein SAMN05421679_10960 [Epilithonimonas pallida]
MTTQRINLELKQENIKNIYTDSYGKFIAITSQNNLIGNDFKFELKNEFHFPIVRYLNNENLLIIDDNDQITNNAFILDFEGNIIKKFNAGIRIQDVIITKNKIVISYFDEGILGKNGPNNEGLTVFNFNGELRYGYKSSTGDNNLIDCYCLTNFGNKKVVFYGYTDFKLHELNLETYEVTSYETPKEFLGATSISSKNDNLIFHSSYEDKTSFYIWNLHANEVEKIESEEKKLIGTDNGSFFKFDKKHFTLIKLYQN